MTTSPDYMKKHVGHQLMSKRYEPRLVGTITRKPGQTGAQLRSHLRMKDEIAFFKAIKKLENDGSIHSIFTRRYRKGEPVFKYYSGPNPRLKEAEGEQ